MLFPAGIILRLNKYHRKTVHWLTSEDLLSLDSALIFHKNGYSIVAAYSYAEV